MKQPHKQIYYEPIKKDTKNSPLPKTDNLIEFRKSKKTQRQEPEREKSSNRYFSRQSQNIISNLRSELSTLRSEVSKLTNKDSNGSIEKDIKHQIFRINKRQQNSENGCDYFPENIITTQQNNQIHKASKTIAFDKLKSDFQKVITENEKLRTKISMLHDREQKLIKENSNLMESFYQYRKQTTIEKKSPLEEADNPKSKRNTEASYRVLLDNKEKTIDRLADREKQASMLIKELNGKLTKHEAMVSKLQEQLTEKESFIKKLQTEIESFGETQKASRQQRLSIENGYKETIEVLNGIIETKKSSKSRGVESELKEVIKLKDKSIINLESDICYLEQELRKYHQLKETTKYQVALIGDLNQISMRQGLKSLNLKFK